MTKSAGKVHRVEIELEVAVDTQRHHSGDLIVNMQSCLSRHLHPLGLATLALVAMASPSLLAQSDQHYTLTNLTSNLASVAPTRDANLVNPWGLARSSKGSWWVADTGTGLSTLYDGTGKVEPLVVTVPPGSTDSPTGSPIGIVFNGNPNAFPIAPGKAASFLFITADGTISGWNPTVKATSAVIVVNNKGAAYKGGTIATVTSPSGEQSTFLYVANFSSGKVEIYDTNFKPVNFDDAFVNDTPGNYAPFNVQNIGGNIYVAYAQQGSGKHFEQVGSGRGLVKVFSPTGKLLLTLQRGQYMNAPWGLALASGDFGSYSHDLLVGQFGSGEITVFDPLTGNYLGTLNGADNTPLKIDGLWALAFGNDQTAAGPATSLYFSAGPNHEANGLFGSITATENVEGNDD